MDVYTPNTAAGIANSRDKLRAIQILSRHDVGIPATTFVRNQADVLPAIERVGGAPVVIKLLEGTQGIGVILAPDTKVAEAVIETGRRSSVVLKKRTSTGVIRRTNPARSGTRTYQAYGSRLDVSTSGTASNAG